jgi:sphingomyelin phosphodiesterase acid-like 3
MGFFLWLSDLHLDPYYGQPSAYGKSKSGCTTEDSITSKPYGLVGCDAPLSLIGETLKHIASSDDASQKNPGFILITGDFARHGTDTLSHPVTETGSILRFLTEAIQSYFPSNSTADGTNSTLSPMTVIPTLGNNDVTPDYYLDLMDSTNTNKILQMALNGLRDFFVSDDEIESFSRGGYFARNVSDTLTVLSLNTIFYSINHQPAWQTSPLSPSRLDDPMGQFKWLKEQLNLASTTGRSVYIAGHIPPSIGSFRHAQFWNDHYLERYFDILEEAERDNNLDSQHSRRQIVAGHLFGHLHSEEFRLLRPTRTSSASKAEVPLDSADESNVWNDNLPLLIASSVTPVYGANPSYRLVQYQDEDGTILDYQTFFLDLKQSYSIDNADSDGLPIKPIWTKLPPFTETYDVDDLSAVSLNQIVDQLSAPIGVSKHLWDVFLSRQDVYANQDVPSSEEDSSDSAFDDGVSCDDWCRREWLCTIKATSKHQFISCLEESATGSSSLGFHSLLGISFIIVVAGVASATFFVVSSRYLTRRHYEQPPQDPQMPDNDIHQDCELRATGSANGELT